MDDFETRLQRELQRVAGEARGPAPRAAQARYRQARPSIFVFSKLAVGVATVALAFSVSVVAAAAFSGSSPTDWGQAVKLAVERCQNEPGSELGACVGSFVPEGLPVPTALRPADSSQGGDRGHSSQTAAPARSARPKSSPTDSRKQVAPGAPPSQIPIVPGQQPVAGALSPVPSAATAATPNASPSALPASTPTPTPTVAPPPTPTPTAPAQGGQIPPPDPSPSTPPPALPPPALPPVLPAVPTPVPTP
jgi:hypothetical protein